MSDTTTPTLGDIVQDGALGLASIVILATSQQIGVFFALTQNMSIY